jgi:hypothetical protein
MSKKNAVLFCILILVAALGKAQTTNHAIYREITLPQFETWKQGVPREGTDPTLFKVRVLFEELSDTTISFTDSGRQAFIYFTVDVDKPWPEMTVGQPVTIYFTAAGSWSWNRVLDEIDTGTALAYDQTADDPAEDNWVEEDSFQTEYAEAEEPEYSDDPSSPEDFLTEVEVEEERPAASRRRLPPPVPSSTARRPPAPVPAVSSAGSSAGGTAKITGTAPRPGKVYRLQVGAYAVQRNAISAFNRLKDAGFSPAYERYRAYFRVVLSGIRAADVEKCVERIGQAGFTEVWCREE